jgi:hypothetical protein
MRTGRSNRVIRVLTLMVSIAYYGLGLGAVVVLVGAPAARVFASSPDWEMGLTVPARTQDSAATVLTNWGPAQLELDDVRANLKLPIVLMPWWLFTLLWLHVAVYFGLVMMSVFQLRRIFQSVRQGAPFDARNAVRLRSLGTLLIGVALFRAAAEFITAIAIRRGITGSGIRVDTGLHIDFPFFFLALTVVALAEIFRRGAELESEQSLVI